MKISAVISEFNPFHNGHSHLISEAKKTSDAVICVMSGSFVQRGDAAIFDKFIRAKAAVLNGADLVLELPTVFAASTAERFAYGAVSLLKNLGCVDEIIFGSESGNIRQLTSAAELLLCEPPEISEKIRKNLSLGLSYPVSRKIAFSEKIESDIFDKPNNILAVEYIKAAKQLNYNVKFKTIQRIGDYHSSDYVGKYLGAGAIREMIYTSKDYTQYVPENTIELYKNADIHDLSKLNSAVTYLLRTCSAEYIKGINDVCEGLENALISAGKKYSDIQSVVDCVSGKRYTKTKISRILISLLLGTDKSLVRENPNYARVLSFNDVGRVVLNTVKNNITTIVKVADYKNPCPLFQKDLLASDIYSLCGTNKEPGGSDYRTPPSYIKVQISPKLSDL